MEAETAPFEMRTARCIITVRHDRMPLYRVLIHGRNFRLNIEGKWEKFGFYTPRFAEASDSILAEQAALEDFRAVCAWMSTVRRRIGAYVEPEGFPWMRETVAVLLDGPTETADARIEAFWDHAFASYWDWQLGVRHDAGSAPARDWAALRTLASYK